MLAALGYCAAWLQLFSYSMWSDSLVVLEDVSTGLSTLSWVFLLNFFFLGSSKENASLAKSTVPDSCLYIFFDKRNDSTSSGSN